MTEKMILLVIADHASDDGTESWPSQATMARKASCTIRTVQRTINELVSKGYLWMEKGKGGSATCRDDRRPHRYTIRIEKLRGDTVSSRRGDFDDNNEATLTTTTGRLSRPMNHPYEPSIELAQLIPMFDEFWKIYPIKMAKKKAMQSFDKALQETTFEEIMAGVRRFAADPNRTDAFTPYPTTWLNQGRWADEPLPEKVLSLEERKLKEKQAIKERNKREKEEQERLSREMEEARINSVPMPDELRKLFKK